MPLNKSLESELDAILGRHPKLIVGVFKGEPMLTPETLGLKEALVALIQSELKKQREDIRSKLPEKRVDQNEDAQPYAAGQANGWNDYHNQITKILDGDKP